MIELSIEKVKNGYTIDVTSVSCSSEDTWVASTQDEVATVVKTIIRGAFDYPEHSLPSGASDDSFTEEDDEEEELREFILSPAQGALGRMAKAEAEKPEEEKADEEE